jgi:hypothetical protein
MTPKRKVTLYLEPATVKQLRKYVFDHEGSMSSTVQLALERYLDSSVPAPPVEVARETEEVKKARLGRPTERQISLLGTDKLRKLGYDC